MSKPISRWSIALLTALSIGSAAEAQRLISVATLAPSGSTWMRGLDAANRELRRRTNGAVALRFYPGGVQGDESEVVRKMRQGRLDGAVLTGVGLGQIHRPVLAFMLPGMFPDRAAMDRSRAALGTLVEQQFNTNGFVLASWGESGTPRLFSQRAIHTPSDLQQVHPWVWRDDVILPALYTEAGARGVPLALPEVLSALQTNRIDTFVAPPLAALALQWSTRASFVSEGANSYGVGGIVISRRAWDSLTPEQQTTTREVINQFNTLIGRNVNRDDESALRAMTTRGVQQVVYTPAERTQWAALFQRTRARLVGTVSDAAWMERVRSGH
jgi:TRAP-type C4-dicarboxylate transport system substrate-binding protein